MLVGNPQQISHRKRIGFAVTAMISLVCVAGLWWAKTYGKPTDPSSSSGLSVLPPAVDLARKSPDDASDYIVHFRLINTGKRIVRIQSVRSSCGCTVAGDPSKLVLQPTEEAKLDVQATLPRYGEKRATVTMIIFDGDGESKAIQIPLVLRGVEPQPPYVDEAPDRLELRPTEDDREFRREFELLTVESASEKPWLIGFDSTTPLLQTEIVDCTTIGNRGNAIARRYKVVLTFDATTETAQPLGAWLSVIGRTKSTGQTNRIFVMAEKMQSSRISPSRVFFTQSEIAKGEILERNVVLINDPDDGSEVNVLPAEEPWLSATVLSTQQKNIHMLKVRVKPSEMNEIRDISFLRSELKIHVVGSATQIRLPVTVQGGREKERDQP